MPRGRHEAYGRQVTAHPEQWRALCRADTPADKQTAARCSSGQMLACTARGTQICLRT